MEMEATAGTSGSVVCGHRAELTRADARAGRRRAESRLDEVVLDRAHEAAQIDNPMVQGQYLPLWNRPQVREDAGA